MASEQPRLLKEGDRFGDYTVVKLLGKGGMGAVYLMRGASGSEYAVKIMFPDKVTHDLRRRFAKEAEFAIKIRHRNLVSVYDVGEDPETGLCYMIMDYVAGGSLSDLLKRRGRLPIDEAVSIASQIASALEVAHRHGLVHRDIKPDNILFDADGTPRLADLGIAKFDESQQSMVTTTGMVIGTPAYMAPEQMLNSHAIDARADIYSLGVVLYEMLSGKRPNEGRTAIELMAKAIKGDPLPDIKTICPELSVAVAHVVSLLCAPKPEVRPQTALAAADILRKAASGKLVLLSKKPQSSTADARKKRIPFMAIGSVVGIGALCTIAVACFLNKPTPRLPPEQGQVIVVTNVVERVTEVTNVVERVAVVTNVVANTNADTLPQRTVALVDEAKAERKRQEEEPVAKARPVKEKRARAAPFNGECRTFTLPGGAKVEMIYVAPGSFMMGHPGSSGHATQHRVTLTKGYWIGKYPVTQRQWKALVRANGVTFAKGEPTPWFSREGGGRNCVSGLDTSDFPMECISWDDCKALVDALNGVKREGRRWSLPTEAQWEFAARGGTKSRGYTYSGGNDMDTLGWYNKNSGRTTHSVREKDIGNELGIVGMSGNVWEWCNDWYGKYYSNSPTEDPQGPASGSYRVLRGGSWNYNAQNCRSAPRYSSTPSNCNIDIGFRLCCSAGLREGGAE